MGGKTKQRTKNNLRPSSSSRSAELLSNSLALDGGLVTVGSGKVLPALFPTLAAVTPDYELSPEFQICIKKLNKKNPITRTKALHELCALENSSAIDEVAKVLPIWAHAYKALTADTDRKVREMTQVFHSALVGRCGRRIAKQLKALLPPWLQAQYDEHAPAHIRAQNSLKETFPDDKLPEAISFCKSEVMAHFTDNLIGNTQPYFNNKIDDVEERAHQVTRIVTSTLRGLEYFIPVLPLPHHDWLWEQLGPLLDSNAFWKFAVHNNEQVRAAWYGAMSRIIERYSEQFAVQFGLKLTRLVLNATKENNALVSSHVWTTMLMFMHHVLDWHKYLEKKELLVKRIMDVLESGGWGDARHLCSMLLPILAHLPEDMLNKQFYETFFNSIFNGLEKKNIISWKSERQSWITSIAECLRYLSLKQLDYVVDVVTVVHRTWLENVFSSHYDEITRSNLIKSSATNMCLLVKYWLKQTKQRNSEKYEQLLRNFWQNVGSTILFQIDRCGTDLEEIDQMIHGHILLLQTLKTSFSHTPKKQLTIKFDDDVQTNTKKYTAVTQECDASMVQRYKHNLEQLAHKICANYLEMAANRQIGNPILNPITTVLIEFDSKEMFEALAEQFHLGGLFYLYESVLKVWLTGDDDTMRCKHVVNIVFQMMQYLSSEEQDAVFDSFKQFPPAVVEWCLSVCVSHPHATRPSSVRWTQSACATDALVHLARRAALEHDAPAAQLLFISLAQGGERSLFSDKAICQVITAMNKAIARMGDSLERSGALAARLVTQLADSPFVADNEEHFSTLVLRLFTINIIIPRKDSPLTLDTWREIRSSWQDGVAALSQHARHNFLSDVGELLTVHLLGKVKQLHIQEIEHALSLCPHLFNRSFGDESDLLNDNSVAEIVQFTQQIFEIETKEVVAIESAALRYDTMVTQINCLYEDDNAPATNVITKSNDNNREVLSNVDVLLYVNKLLFRAIYLRTMLVHKIVSDDEHKHEQTTWCESLLSDQYIQQEFCNVLYDYAVVMSLNEGYCFWAHHDIIEKCEKKMNSVLLEIISVTSQTVCRSIVLSLSALAAAKGYYWAYAHRWYLINCGDNTDHLYEGHALEEIVSGNGFFHVLQAKAKWCAERELRYKVAYLVMLRSWNVAHSRLMTPQLVTDMAACKRTNSLDVIVNAYYNHQQTMLYDMDISSAPWSQLVSNVTVVEFLSLMVERYGWDASAHQWDFTTITLCSLLTSLRKSIHNWATTRVAMLARSVLRLYMMVAKFVANIESESELREPQTHVFDLIKEWQDIFAPDIHHNIYTIIIHVLSTCESTSLTSPEAVMLSSLIECVPQLSWTTLAPSRTQHELALAKLAQAAAAAMRRTNHPAAHYLAYHLLLNLAESLVFDDSQKLSSWSEENSTDGDEEKAPPEFLFDYFQETFTHLEEFVETALNSVVLGEDVCEIVPLTDSHSMTLSFLLLADALAVMCKLARGDLEQFYIQIYRERKYAPALLTTSLRLLPGAVFSYAEDNTGTASPPACHKEDFHRVEPFAMHRCSRGADVPALACRCVQTAVCGAGCGSARGWWGAAGARTSRILERLVSAYVAPAATRAQLAALHARKHELPDTQIQIAWSSNEVVCQLTVDERQVELHVWLSRAHPLVPARLEADEALGGGTAWLALYLAYQNGTLLNALKMWTRAVNARVERAPQCYICYCRLHAATGHLPRVPCHQCHSKFHSQCLRKWFTTSNKSNCPLCRATF